MSGVKSPFEKLKEDIDDNISKIPNLSEQLKYLNETQEKLFQKEGNSLYFLEANNEIEKRKSDIAKEIENRYKDFLAAHQSFEEREKCNH
jgi:vacuolar-type H+-ATPase subunit I/STV1